MQHRRFNPRNIWKYVLSVVLVVIYCMPLYVMLNMAFKSMTDSSSRLSPPKELFWGNFAQLFQEGSIVRALINTLVITVFTVLIEVVLGCMAAYPLARHRSRFNKLINAVMMGVMMIPPLSILVGVYSTLVSLHATSTFWGMIIVSAAFGLPMPIYFFTKFITTIPRSLDEAAQIDGCNTLQVFFHVILPQMKPAIATIVILNGVGMWNEYGYALYILQKPSMYTLTLTISQYFSSGGANNLNGAAAAACIATLPMIIMYLFLQRYFIQGTVDSAVKG
ncbi:carbohydrate ABC transporter permease [Bifidobacterium canis]|uniref:Maltose ABC transporter permease n=1 Tax=Bifidobacterium canis TaxID=2610880 RepID=A0A7K1J6E7_9BIFI|nr:carbohydrate ABC transporter permease [Bifidobacterium canis]MUH60109.1 maltose ABC transporter permease [Bifidobacterium canis]